MKVLYSTCGTILICELLEIVSFNWLQLLETSTYRVQQMYLRRCIKDVAINLAFLYPIGKMDFAYLTR